MSIPAPPINNIISDEELRLWMTKICQFILDDPSIMEERASIYFDYVKSKIIYFEDHLTTNIRYRLGTIDGFRNSREKDTELRYTPHTHIATNGITTYTDKVYYLELYEDGIKNGNILTLNVITKSDGSKDYSFTIQNNYISNFQFIGVNIYGSGITSLLHWDSFNIYLRDYKLTSLLSDNG